MSDPLEPRRTGPPTRPELREVVERQREVSQKPTREEQIAGFRGWTERGYLPHRDEPGLTQFVTFRLADSFPTELQDEWEKLLKIEDPRTRRAQLEAWLDLGHGICHLKDDHVTRIVAESLHHFDGQRYLLRAFTIMPNHVHVLLDVTTSPLAGVIKSWKQFSGTQANRLLNRRGPFWQKDYWDTYMRDYDHEAATIRYIRNNPVQAGLAKDWKDWPWTYVRSDLECG